MATGDHPEGDLLSDDMHQKYQMLIGMLNWVVPLGRLETVFLSNLWPSLLPVQDKGILIGQFDCLDN